MITRRQILALAAAGALLSAAPSFAHHSWPVDFSKEITIRGAVTSYNWGNPHVMFGMDVQGANGNMEKWNVGGPSTNRMAANGWERATLKPGDVVTAPSRRCGSLQPCNLQAEDTLPPTRKVRRRRRLQAHVPLVAVQQD